MRKDGRYYRNLERIIKGAASHRRLAILDLLSTNPEMAVGEIADTLKADYKALSEHSRKLELAGLVMKRREGNQVRLALTERGKSILQFCRNIV